VSAGYSGTAGLALQQFDLNVPARTRAALVGPNGSGKSTLLKAVAGLLPGVRATSGSTATRSAPATTGSLTCRSVERSTGGSRAEAEPRDSSKKAEDV